MSVNGTCLTVTAYGSGAASFDISQRTAEITTLKTLALTTLKSLQVGDRGNVDIDQTTRTLVDTLHRVLRKV